MHGTANFLFFASGAFRHSKPLWLDQTDPAQRTRAWDGTSHRHQLHFRQVLCLPPEPWKLYNLFSHPILLVDV